VSIGDVISAIPLGRVTRGDARRALLLLVFAGACLWLARKSSPRTLFTLWAIAISGVTVPWLDLHRTPLLRVALIPFVSPPVSIIDIVANIALFVPFGFFLGRMRPEAGVLRRAALWAAVFSVLLETSQLFSRGRIVSGTDVATNVIGAVVGAQLWHVLGRPSAWRSRP
jgi:glycopeptide antibiotics resistance protein